MRACPLARAWAGVKPSAGVWGRRKSPTTEKRLNRCQSSRVGVFDGQSSSNSMTVSREQKPPLSGRGEKPVSDNS